MKEIIWKKKTIENAPVTFNINIVEMRLRQKERKNTIPNLSAGNSLVLQVVEIRCVSVCSDFLNFILVFISHSTSVF